MTSRLKANAPATTWTFPLLTISCVVFKYCATPSSSRVELMASNTDIPFLINSTKFSTLDVSTCICFIASRYISKWEWGLLFQSRSDSSSRTRWLINLLGAQYGLGNSASSGVIEGIEELKFPVNFHYTILCPILNGTFKSFARSRI